MSRAETEFPIAQLELHRWANRACKGRLLPRTVHDLIGKERLHLNFAFGRLPWPDLLKFDQ